MPLEAELLDRVSSLVGRRDLTQVEYANWHGGPATGGPNGDGLYPLSDSTGFVRMVPSPAKIAELTVGSARTVTASVAALAGETITADTSGGSFAVTLPPMPIRDARVTIRDKGLSWSTHPLTIAADRPIAAPLDDGLANLGGYELVLTYDGSVWAVVINYIYGG